MKETSQFENKSSKDITVFIQFILLITLFLLYISAFFISELSNVLRIVLSSNLFLMGYHNHTKIKRKYFTFIYVIAGIFFLGLAVYSLYGN